MEEPVSIQEPRGPLKPVSSLWLTSWLSLQNLSSGEANVHETLLAGTDCGQDAS